MIRDNCGNSGVDLTSPSPREVDLTQLEPVLFPCPSLPSVRNSKLHCPPPFHNFTIQFHSLLLLPKLLTSLLSTVGENRNMVDLREEVMWNSNTHYEG